MILTIIITSKQPPNTVTKVEKSVNKRIAVLYGTETGNAEYCADLLTEAIEEAGFHAEPIDMGDYNAEQIRDENLVFIVTSTYGNGDPPSNARQLLTFLKNDQSDYVTVKFAVCALGDSSYPFFAQCGKDFDEALRMRGAKRVIERIDCDEDFEDAFDQFKAYVLHYLASNQMELRTLFHM